MPVGVAAFALAMASPVSAASSAAASITMSPTLAALVLQTGCKSLPTPSPVRKAARYTTVAKTKSGAIVGREMSALERIRAQQSASAPSATLANAPTGANLEPAAGTARKTLSVCRIAEFEAPHLAANSSFATATSSDFLASQRVEIKRTSFDQAWKRVGNEAVSGLMPRAFRAASTPSLEVVQGVNRWVNRKIQYVEDRQLYGLSDYWAGARLTMALERGDCEDIALTKMQLLAAIGVSRDDMFLTIARDTIRRADHALLIVRIDGRFVVLDNTTDTVLDGAYAHDYHPVLSFAQSGTWVHGR
ncbi:MAG: transglutaminase-like cysteine peptidase [Pseudomonadota bacterium]